MFKSYIHKTKKKNKNFDILKIGCASTNLKTKLASKNVKIFKPDSDIVTRQTQKAVKKSHPVICVLVSQFQQCRIIFHSFRDSELLVQPQTLGGVPHPHPRDSAASVPWLKPENRDVTVIQTFQAENDVESCAFPATVRAKKGVSGKCGLELKIYGGNTNISPEKALRQNFRRTSRQRL